MVAYCTACGALRGPLTRHSVTLAGRSSKLGGSAATIFGWFVLATGWLVALSVFAVLAALFGTAPITWVLSLPFAIVATAIWVVSFWAGKSLKSSGETLQRTTEEQAVFALAEQRRGRLRSLDVAGSLNRSLPAAESILTEMAKRFPEQMAVDVEDSGTLLFRFPRIDLEHRTRVVDAAYETEPGRGAAAGQRPRVVADPPLKDPAPYPQDAAYQEIVQRKQSQPPR
jgi:hypothetical protein